MPIDIMVELRCIQNKDGSYNAGAFENGKQIIGTVISSLRKGTAIHRPLYRNCERLPGVPVQLSVLFQVYLRLIEGT